MRNPRLSTWRPHPRQWRLTIRERRPLEQAIQICLHTCALTSLLTVLALPFRWGAVAKSNLIGGGSTIETPILTGWELIGTSGIALTLTGFTLIALISLVRRSPVRAVVLLALIPTLVFQLFAVVGGGLFSRVEIPQTAFRLAEGGAIAAILLQIPIWFLLIAQVLMLRKRRKSVIAAYSMQDRETATDEIVLLIHGTGAKSEDEMGNRWWQVGSASWQTINARLPERVRCHTNGEVFHWSGANRESERREAGIRLARYIHYLTRTGVKCHLVGHSHGGSVIWHALRWLSRKKTMKVRIGEVILLGTPFLRYVERPILPAFIAVCSGFAFLAAESGDLSLFWRIRRYLAPEHVFPLNYYVILLALLGLITLLATLALLLRVIMKVRCRFERKADSTILSALGDRLCHLWCKDDEALAGLRATLIRPLRLVLPMSLSGQAILSRLRILALWPIILLYNKVVAPVLNGFIWDILTTKAQGSDLAGAMLQKAAPSPIDGWNPRPIPRAPSEMMSERANSAAHALLSRGRSALHNVTTGERVTDLDVILSGNEFVHAHYYDEPWIIERVVDRISPGHSRDDAVKKEQTESGAFEGTAEPHTPHQRLGNAWWWAWTHGTHRISGILLILLAILVIGPVSLMLGNHALMRYTNDWYVGRALVRSTLVDVIETRTTRLSAVTAEDIASWSLAYTRRDAFRHEGAIERLPPELRFAVASTLIQHGRLEDAKSVIPFVEHPCLRDKPLPVCRVRDRRPRSV